MRDSKTSIVGLIAHLFFCINAVMPLLSASVIASEPCNASMRLFGDEIKMPARDLSAKPLTSSPELAVKTLVINSRDRLAVSSSGEWIAHGARTDVGVDLALYRVDPSTGLVEIATTLQLSSAVESLSFRPDSKMLAIAFAKEGVALVDLADPSRPKNLETTGKTRAQVVWADNQQVVVHGLDFVNVFDSVSGKRTYEPIDAEKILVPQKRLRVPLSDTFEVKQTSLSPSGQIFVYRREVKTTTSPEKVETRLVVVDLRTSVEHQIPFERSKYHWWLFRPASPDGGLPESLLVANPSLAPATLQKVDLRARFFGDMTPYGFSSGRVYGASFSRDGKRLLVTADRSIEGSINEYESLVLHAKTGAVIKQFVQPWFNGGVFSPDGELIYVYENASGSTDTATNHLVDVKTGGTLATTGPDGTIQEFDSHGFDPFVRQGFRKVFDFVRNRYLPPMADTIESLVSTDGRYGLIQQRDQKGKRWIQIAVIDSAGAGRADFKEDEINHVIPFYVGGQIYLLSRPPGLSQQTLYRIKVDGIARSDQ